LKQTSKIALTAKQKNASARRGTAPRRKRITLLRLVAKISW
jgi:hypothetical protein